MHSRKLLTFLMALAPVSLALPATFAADTPPPSGAAAPAKAQRGPVLEKGMAADQIVAAIGQPEEKRPMKVPEGSTDKAETWIYRQAIGSRQVQVASGTRALPAYTGGMGNDALGVTPEIIYSMKTVTTYRVTSLLMVNGHLVLARQTTEQSDRFQ